MKRDNIKMSVQPFEVQIPDTVLNDLHERLAHTRWPDAISDSGLDYGTNLDYLKELVDYWHYKFNWHEQEVKLNKFVSVEEIRQCLRQLLDAVINVRTRNLHQ